MDVALVTGPTIEYLWKCVNNPEKVSTMRWTKVTESLPAPAERVLVLTDTGHWLAGRRSLDPWSGGHRWMDDQVMPIRGVVAWSRVVAGSETA